MGAAIGIFQEALVVQTWFTFQVPASPSRSTGLYGVLWQTNWDWDLNLTIYHAVVSITAPLILIHLFYPRQARVPWLGTKRVIALVLWLLVVCGTLAFGVVFKSFTAAGYPHPPLFHYLVMVGLTAVAFLLGCFLRFPKPRPSASRRAPGLWTVRFTLGGLMVLFFLVIGLVLPATHLPASLTMFLALILLSFGLWRVRSWSARSGWSSRHQLAVATGILMYFIFVFGPLVEFVARIPLHSGMTLVNLLAFGGLMLFDRQLSKLAGNVTGSPDQGHL